MTAYEETVKVFPKSVYASGEYRQHDKKGDAADAKSQADGSTDEEALDVPEGAYVGTDTDDRMVKKASMYPQVNLRELHADDIMKWTQTSESKGSSCARQQAWKAREHTPRKAGSGSLGTGQHGPT